MYLIIFTVSNIGMQSSSANLNTNNALTKVSHVGNRLQVQEIDFQMQRIDIR